MAEYYNFTTETYTDLVNETDDNTTDDVTFLPSDNATRSDIDASVTTESQPSTPPPQWSTILFVTAEIIICITIVIGNSLVLRAIHTERKLQTFTNYFVASLAVADLFVGVVGIPTSLVAFFGYPRGFIGCLFENTTIIMLTQVSIFGLAMISLERFVAIRYPFFYEENSRRRNALVAIAICWVFALLVGMVPIMGWNLRRTYSGEFCTFMEVVSMQYMVFFNFFGFVLLPLLLMFCVYCYIFAIVRQQLKMIAKQEISLKPSPGPSRTRSESRGSSDDSYTDSSLPYSQACTFVDSLSQEHTDVYSEHQHSRSISNKKDIYWISSSLNNVSSRSHEQLRSAQDSENQCELVNIRRNTNESFQLSVTEICLSPHLLERVQNSDTNSAKQNGKRRRSTPANDTSTVSCTQNDKQTLNHIRDQAEEVECAEKNTQNQNAHSNGESNFQQHKHKHTTTQDSCNNLSVIERKINTHRNSPLTPKGASHPRTQKQHNPQQNSNMKSRKSRRRFLHALRRDLRAAKWFAIVIAMFAFCWLPLHILNALTLLVTPMPAPAIILAVVLSHANSAINPVLYAYSNTKFKAAMTKLLCCGRGQFGESGRSSDYRKESRSKGRQRNKNKGNNGNGAGPSNGQLAMQQNGV